MSLKTQASDIIWTQSHDLWPKPCSGTTMTFECWSEANDVLNLKKSSDIQYVHDTRDRHGDNLKTYWNELKCAANCYKTFRFNGIWWFDLQWLKPLLPSMFVIMCILSFVCLHKRLCVRSIQMNLTRVDAIASSSLRVCYVIHTSRKRQSFIGAPGPRYQRSLYVSIHLNIGRDSRERGGKQTNHCGQTRGLSAPL